MIELTRLNGSPMLVNSDLIKTAESAPDTMLTLINGEKLIVRETSTEILEKVLAYRAQLLAVMLRRVPSLVEQQRAVSMTSLNLAGFSSETESTGNPAGSAATAKQ